MFFTGIGPGKEADYHQKFDFKQINANEISMICQSPTRMTIFHMAIPFGL